MNKSSSGTKMNTGGNIHVYFAIPHSQTMTWHMHSFCRGHTNPVKCKHHGSGEVLTFSHLLLSPVAHADRVIAAACLGVFRHAAVGEGVVCREVKLFDRVQTVFLFEMNPPRSPGCCL